MLLLAIKTFEDLLGKVSYFRLKAKLPHDWEVNLVATSNDAEIAFLIRNGNRLKVVECKFSTTPSLSRGIR